jgi:hypothetical protein
MAASASANDSSNQSNWWPASASGRCTSRSTISRYWDSPSMVTNFM